MRCEARVTCPVIIIATVTHSETLQPLTKRAPCLQLTVTATRRNGGAIILSAFRPASCAMDVAIATTIATRQAAVSSFLQTSQS